MLTRLLIKNIGLIDHLEMDFDPGFNVITGETGASKTIILQAAHLLTGGRALAEFIKGNAESAHIEGVFEGEAIADLNPILVDRGIPVEDNLVIKRVIKRNGTSQIFVNGSSVQLRELEEFGSQLLDYSGQTDKWLLLKRETQLAILNQFAALVPRCEVFRHNYDKAQDLTAKIESLRKLCRHRQNEIEDLRFRQKELEGLSLQEEDHTSLLAQARLLKNAQLIADLLTACQECLSNEQSGLSHQLNRLMQNVEKLKPYFPDLQSFIEEITLLANSTSELGLVLQQKENSLEFDPEESSVVEAQLARIDQLKRKYQKSLAELAAEKEAIASSLNNLDSSDQQLCDQVGELNSLLRALNGEAKHISDERKDTARKFMLLVSAELENLGFPKNSFIVWLDSTPPGNLSFYNPKTFTPESMVAIGPDGGDDVSFLFRPNVGESAKELKAIASGGELSRVLLAIKSVATQPAAKREGNKSGTMILDEIDSGIGGEVANSVAELLKEFSNRSQIICISHLPQIAAASARHFRVKKETSKTAVKIAVELLDQKERADELSRMIGGAKHTPHTIKVAEEMIKHNESSSTSGQ
jgi:DNA repair protein RecN (Recombination protein N)